MGLSPRFNTLKFHTKTESSKPTKIASTSHKKIPNNDGLCKDKELYSLLPLGIESPKRREQGRVANESN
jgi:hypothetical protein